MESGAQDKQQYYRNNYQGNYRGNRGFYRGYNRGYNRGQGIGYSALTSDSQQLEETTVSKEPLTCRCKMPNHFAKHYLATHDKDGKELN